MSLHCGVGVEGGALPFPSALTWLFAVACRSIGYFLEAVVPLCLFAKTPVRIIFTGVTNHPKDPSIELLKSALPPVLKAFGVDTAGFTLKVKRRGFQPLGGGEVEFRCPNLRELTPINLCDEGTLKRVRGAAITAKVSPQVANRLTQSARCGRAAESYATVSTHRHSVCRCCLPPLTPVLSSSLPSLSRSPIAHTRRVTGVCWTTISQMCTCLRITARARTLVCPQDSASR